MTKLLLVSWSLLLFSGCSAQPQANNALKRVDCENHQGVWFEYSSPQKKSGLCVTKTTDEGKACRDTSDCQSVCATKLLAQGEPISDGRCFGWSSVEGQCVNLVNNGIATGTVCSD